MKLIDRFTMKRTKLVAVAVMAIVIAAALMMSGCLFVLPEKKSDAKPAKTAVAATDNGSQGDAQSATPEGVIKDNLLTVQQYSTPKNVRVQSEIYLKDVEGNLYVAAETLVANDNAFYPDGAVEFFLNDAYDKLEFTLYMPEEAFSGDEVVAAQYFKVYGDGKLLYEAPKIDKDNYKAFDVSVNVSGVKVLRIELEGLYRKHFGIDHYDYPIVAATKLYVTRK